MCVKIIMLCNNSANICMRSYPHKGHARSADKVKRSDHLTGQ